MLRLDRLLANAGDGESLERLLGSLQSVNNVEISDWESVCPVSGHRGLVVRVARIEEEAVVLWCSGGCPDQAVLAALTERLRRPEKPESQKAAPIEAPAAVPATTSLLGLTEAAQVLGCHRRTVRAYIRAGLFPGRLLAGRWKIRREELDVFIERALGSRGESVPAARSGER